MLDADERRCFSLKQHESALHCARVRCKCLRPNFISDRVYYTVYSGYTFHPKSLNLAVSNCSLGTLINKVLPSASSSFVSAS